jgi:signal transduction histidine kinase
MEATAEARTAALSPEAEAQVFRVIQESLTNVRKHADARRATLTLDADGSTLVIRVVDDGRGFLLSGPEGAGSSVAGSPAAGTPPPGVGSPPPGVGSPPPGVGSPPAGWPHYGLEAMRERATSIGGTIEWSTMAEGGTAVQLTVPVVAPPAAIDAPSDGRVPESAPA